MWFLPQWVLNQNIFHPFYGFQIIIYVYHGLPSGRPWLYSYARIRGLVTEAMWVGIAITAFPPFYQRTRTMALWFFALAVVVLAVAVVENAGVMSLVSLSEAKGGRSCRRFSCRHCQAYARYRSV